MKRITKRVTALALALTMALGLSACGQTGTGAQSDEEQITLSIGITASPLVTEWENNKFTLWLEEQTGYNIEFVFFSTENSAQQLATMVAGNEKLPDILCLSLGEAVRRTYGEDGYLLDLGANFFDNEEVMKNYEYDDLLAKYAAPDILERVYTEGRDSEGRWWSFPYVSASINARPTTMMYINKTWLDKLGLEMPTNTEELIAVAEAFKTQDPNGNGIADEIPMLGKAGAGSVGDISRWLINNWIYLNDTHLLNVTDEGEIYLPYDQEEYREALKYCNELCERGLLSELCWSIKDNSELKAIWTPVDEVAKVGIVGGNITLSTNAGNPVMYEYEPLPPFEGACVSLNPVSINWYYNYITTDCEHPEAAFDLLCTMASPEGSRWQRYGEEGVDWEWATDYETGRKGIKVLNADAYGGSTDSTWGKIYNAFYWQNEEGKDLSPNYVADPNPPGNEDWATVRQNKYEEHAKLCVAAEGNNPKNRVYAINYSTEEREAMGNCDVDIWNFIGSQRGRFIVGELDINSDNDWENYVDELYSLGAQTFIDQSQSAYDRIQAMKAEQH